METATTLIKVAAGATPPGPAITASPLDNAKLHKRITPDNRQSVRFGGCDLRQAMTFKDYPEVSEPSRIGPFLQWVPTSKFMRKIILFAWDSLTFQSPAGVGLPCVPCGFIILSVISK
jgi:hypothetical protein